MNTTFIKKILWKMKLCFPSHIFLKIRGDGVTDDFLPLNALFNGWRVRYEGEVLNIKNGVIKLPKQLLTRTEKVLKVDGDMVSKIILHDSVMIDGCKSLSKPWRSPLSVTGGRHFRDVLVREI